MDPILKERRRIICVELLAGKSVRDIAGILNDDQSIVRDCIIKLFETHGFDLSLSQIWKQFYK